ncbi:MAG: hypothetical protein ACOVO2_05075 [Emticicia sp.]|uniref:hypothetical protein n=1 Tax=Emticicia sp. TaxID=1930953 RepID=UPI003BA4DD5E
MKENPYAKMTLEELETKAKNAKKATSAIVGLLMVAVFAVVFLAIRQGFSAMTVVPSVLLPMLIINLASLNAIQKEIKSRKS